MRNRIQGLYLRFEVEGFYRKWRSIGKLEEIPGDGCRQRGKCCVMIFRITH